MRVLVTGGAGFIGSNLVRALLAAGHETGVIDDLSTGSAADLRPAAWFRELDVCDPDLTGAVAAFAPEVVVHLAAQVDVTASVEDPGFDRRVNVEGTRAVAVASREAGARLLLFPSSAAVYGPEVPLPTPEGAAKAPANPYGSHKLEAEGVVAHEFGGGGGRDFAIMRFSNVYGPRQLSTGEGGVVAIFADRMLAGAVPVVYGDGAQTRDFVHVSDVVAFMMLAMGPTARLGAPGPDGPAYNVSTGTAVTIEGLADLMTAASGYKGPIAHAEQRPGDVRDSTLDPSKAALSLGWTARKDLPDGLAETLAWFAARSEG